MVKKIVTITAVIFVGLLWVCSPNKAGTDSDTPVEKMVKISSGTMHMGSDDVADHATPTHTVTISEFYIDNTEVTQGAYRALMGFNPSSFKGDSSRPVEWISWYDAVLYCNARSRLDSLDTVYTFSAISGLVGNGCTGLTGLQADISKHGYRLPTEAEWEYACRGGQTTGFYWGDAADSATVSQNAWYLDNAGNSTHAVAKKTANSLGLYDMSGNVVELCWDWLGDYTADSQSDPTGPATGTNRVYRGGSYITADAALHSAYRTGAPPEQRGMFGFRCVRR
jgi:formylglycine-generating enzyme required for sulfatase activity